MGTAHLNNHKSKLLILSYDWDLFFFFLGAIYLISLFKYSLLKMLQFYSWIEYTYMKIKPTQLLLKKETHEIHKSNKHRKHEKHTNRKH